MKQKKRIDTVLILRTLEARVKVAQAALNRYAEAGDYVRAFVWDCRIKQLNECIKVVKDLSR